MSTARRYSDLAIIRRLLWQARAYWPHVLGSLLLGLAAIPLALLLPLPLKIVVDSAIGSHPLPRALAALVPAGLVGGASALAAAVGLLMGVTLLRYLQGSALWLLQTYTGERLLLDFRALLFRHVQRLSLGYHDARGAADTVFRIHYDAPAIQHITINALVPLLTALGTVGGMLYVTARIDWQLALVAAAVTPVLLLVGQSCQRRLRARWSEVRESQSSSASVLQEVLGAIRVVKAFGQEEREHERFVRYSRAGVRGQMDVARIQGVFDLLVGLTLAAGSGAALVIGVLHVRGGTLTLGELLLVMSYLAQLYAPLEAMSKKGADIQSSLASAERAFALLDETPDVVERPHARPAHRVGGAVAFRGVTYAYEAGRDAVRDISFDIAPGSRVGIVGASGAGKTTLLSLMTRCYDPAGGQVLLDGVDLREYKLADLSNQFGIVLQEPVLFATSIAENIAYARPGASDEEITAAARAANAHDFITRLPNGYGTQVGDRGARLSGGERQRISIARAFLRNAPVLVLDEPTSSVDARSEAAIVEALGRLMTGRTTFIIAHRPSTLAHCDICLEMEGGRLVRVAPAGELALSPVAPREAIAS